jgi:hypothetical protein
MQVTKTLTAKLMPDGTNVNLSIFQKQSGVNRSVSVPLSPAEFVVVAELTKFIIPHCLGLDSLTSLSSDRGA